MNSVTSCWMNLKSGLPPRWAMLSTEPVTKLSMAMTLWPRASSRSTRWEPRKPAPPVTTEVGLPGERDDFLVRDMGFSNSRRERSRQNLFATKGGKSGLFRARPDENDGDGAPEDFQVQPQ